jgi:hypothetical protein
MVSMPISWIEARPLHRRGRRGSESRPTWVRIAIPPLSEWCRLTMLPWARTAHAEEESLQGRHHRAITPTAYPSSLGASRLVKRAFPSPVPIVNTPQFEAMREFLFRTVSPVTINHRHCDLNEGKAGDIHGGDRLPWVMADGVDNYENLSRPSSQIVRCIPKRCLHGQRMRNL